MTAEEAAAITVDAEQIADALPRVMAEHGVAIIANVASADDVAALEAAFAADLGDVVDTKAANTCGGAVRNAAAKLEAASSAMPAASAPLLSLDPQVTPGFCSGRGLPGGRFAWQARTLPSVRRVYEVLHGTDDICVGLDHSFFSPGAAPAYQSNPSWPHVDLNTRDESIRDSDGISIGQWTVYQGLLYCWSSESERASTTVVWPGSHLEPCDQIQASVDNGGHHFSMIGNVTDPAARAALLEGWTAGARRVPVPAGALLVWSSRTSTKAERWAPPCAPAVLGAQGAALRRSARPQDEARRRRPPHHALGLARHPTRPPAVLSAAADGREARARRPDGAAADAEQPAPRDAARRRRARAGVVARRRLPMGPAALRGEARGARGDAEARGGGCTMSHSPYCE